MEKFVACRGKARSSGGSTKMLRSKSVCIQDPPVEDRRISNAVLPLGQKYNRSGLTSGCRCGAEGEGRTVESQRVFLEAGKTNTFGTLKCLGSGQVFITFKFELV